MSKRKYVDYNDYLDYEADDGFDNDSEEYEDDYYQCPRDRDRDCRRHRQEDSEEEYLASETVLELDSLLCTEHGKAPAPDCPTCKSVVAILGPERCQYYGIPLPPEQSIPEASSCLISFKQQQGGKKATLTLSKTAVDYGVAVYFSGPMPKPKFDELIRFVFWS